MTQKLGKRPATPKPTDFRWAELAATVALPALPARFGYANIFPGDTWEMYGNGHDDTVRPGFDGCGDCVFAGAAHEHRELSKVVRKVDLPFTGANVVSDYSAVTGYVLDDPDTDQGTYTSEALAYRRKTGIIDAAGVRHKIGAYVSLDPKSWLHLMQATYIFGNAGIGFEFPAVGWEQFDAGTPWDVTDDDGPIEGGHYVPVMGRPRSGVCGLVTWSRRHEMTRAFYEKYNDEAWCYVTPEQLNSLGVGLHGFDVVKLNAWLAALQG